MNPLPPKPWQRLLSTLFLQRQNALKQASKFTLVAEYGEKAGGWVLLWFLSNLDALPLIPRCIVAKLVSTPRSDQVHSLNFPPSKQ
jgi:hypothetical protein